MAVLMSRGAEASEQCERRGRQQQRRQSTGDVWGPGGRRTVVLIVVVVVVVVEVLLVPGGGAGGRRVDGGPRRSVAVGGASHADHGADLRDGAARHRHQTRDAALALRHGPPMKTQRYSVYADV